MHTYEITFFNAWKGKNVKAIVTADTAKKAISQVIRDNNLNDDEIISIKRKCECARTNSKSE